jgi:hypothetical protein
VALTGEAIEKIKVMILQRANHDLYGWRNSGPPRNDGLNTGYLVRAIAWLTSPPGD